MCTQVATILVNYGSEIKAFPFACRSWRCEDCFDGRLRELRGIAAGGEPNTMITLTSRVRDDINPDIAAQQLVVAWRNIVQRAKREGIWKNPQYLAVFEETEKGWPHLHILCRAPYIDQRWLSDRMREYCDSPRVWIQHVYSRRQASRYVAKYVSKGPGRYAGTKRYFRTRNWSLDADPAKPGEMVTYDAVWCVAWGVNYVRGQLLHAGWRSADDDCEDPSLYVASDDAHWPPCVRTGVLWATGPPSGMVSREL